MCCRCVTGISSGQIRNQAQQLHCTSETHTGTTKLNNISNIRYLDCANMFLTSLMLLSTFCYQHSFDNVGSVFFNVKNKSFQDMLKKALFGKWKKTVRAKKRKVKHRKDKKDEYKISRKEIMCNLAAEDSIWIPITKPSPWRLEIDKPGGKMAVNARRPKQSLLILWVWEFVWRVCSVRHASWPHTSCLKGKLRI